MWTYEDAKRIVEECLNKAQQLEGDRIAVNDAATIEKSYGWILFYECEKFVRSRDPADARLYGNFPILVDRETERFTPLPTPWRESLARFERERSLPPQGPRD